MFYNSVMVVSSTIFGRLGDTIGRKRIVIIGFIVSGVVFLCHMFAGDLISLYVIRGCAGIGAGMVPGPLAALASSGSVGIFTACGSFGFMCSSILAGVLKNDTLVFSCAAAMCLIGFLLSLFIKEKVQAIRVPLFPINIIKKNLDVYIPFLIRHSAASAIWGIFPIFLASLGADRFKIGMLYAVNPLMQFTFMLLLARRKTAQLINVGLIASAATFVGYAVVPHWGIVFLFQALLGFSWANLYLGSLKQLLDNNTEQATASGLLNSVIGLSGIIGPLIGGIVTLLGMRVLFFFSATMAFGGFIASRHLRSQATETQFLQ
jgi:MFS family permease